MTDNGRGIDDPQTLLSLGTSEWSGEIDSSESPAGMGFFSLAETHIAQRLLPGETLTIECGIDSTTTVRVALPAPEAAPTA